MNTISRQLLFPLLLSLILAAACAEMKQDHSTRYQPLTAGEGYSETRINNNTYEVSFVANTQSLPGIVEHQLLYRCAELTIQTGYDYFIIRQEENLSQRNMIIEPGQTARTENNLLSHETAPAYQFTIEMFRLPVAKQHPKAYVAADLIKLYEPEIKRP